MKFSCKISHADISRQNETLYKYLIDILNHIFILLIYLKCRIKFSINNVENNILLQPYLITSFFTKNCLVFGLIAVQKFSKNGPFIREFF